MALHRNSGQGYGEFSLTKGKREVKEQLLNEQHHSCAYCTAKISFEKMKVEHWYPQEESGKPGNTNRDLDYSNLLAVCQGCTVSGIEHCDTSKKNRLIDISPLRSEHIDAISYASFSGKISSRNEKHQEELDSVLKLNIDLLAAKRKSLLNHFKLGLHRKYKGRRANYPLELRKQKAKNAPFGMIIIRYLEGKIR